MTESKICTCPSGDGSLRWPCPKHPAVEHERAEFEAWVRRDWPGAPLRFIRDALPVNDPRYGQYCDDALQRAWVGWQARAALAQPSPAQAEAERPEVVGYLLAKGNGTLSILRAGPSDDPVMTVAQHERIVGALRFERQQMDRAFTACINERDAANARLHEVATACATAEQERDAAMARVASLESKLAELEKQDLVDVPGPDEIHQMAFEEGQPADDGDGYLFSAEEFDLFVQRLLDSCAAPVAQAQHSVPEGVTIERDVAGTIHIKVGDFDFIQLQYQRPYTDNASTWKLAERIASLLAAAPGKEGL
ncbi:hypothetical protein ACOKZV_000732 [Pseudomonas aeruginosa]